MGAKIVEAAFKLISKGGSLGAICASIFAAAALLPVQDAEASRYSKFSYGAWDGGVYINDKTGEFSHCAVSADYKSGITLLFSVTKGLKWQVGFSKKSWNLDVGKKYPVRYQVDKRQVHDGVARAATNRLAIINLPGSSQLFYQMRRGRMLRVKAGDDLLAFRLTGTSKMLSRLLNCSRRNTNLFVERSNSSDGFSSDAGSGSGSSNPFANAKPQKRKPASNRRAGISPAHRSEAGLWFKNTLSNSDTPYSVVRNEGKAQRMYQKHAIIWRVGQKTGIVGTLRIFARSKPESMENSVLANEARRCKGDFASKFFKDDGISSRKISRLLTTCRQSGGKMWNVYFAIAEREAGGSYLVTLLSSRASADNVSRAGEKVTASMQMGTAGRVDAGSVDENLPDADVEDLTNL